MWLPRGHSVDLLAIGFGALPAERQLMMARQWLDRAELAVDIGRSSPKSGGAVDGN